MLAATLFAHELAAFGVHVSAGFVVISVPGLAGVVVACRVGVAGCGGGLCGGRSGWAAGVRAGCAEEAGERGDGFGQQGVDAGLLAGGVPGLVASDGAAVPGVGGELAEPGSDRGVDAGGRLGRVSRG
jgi:hypothetical protein